MTGHVANRRALVPITLRPGGQPNLTIQFLVDTGFSHYLALPAAAVIALNLPFLHRGHVHLADASSISVHIHGATILWNGAEREVPVIATGLRALLGTALLDGHELVAQFRDGGRVTVEAFT